MAFLLRIYLIFSLLTGLSALAPSSELFLPETDFKSQQEIVSWVQSHIYKARDVFEKNRAIFKKGMKVPGTPFRFLDGENETIVFYSDHLPGLVFKIPRYFDPFSTIFQEINMEIVSQLLGAETVEISGVRLNKCDGFIPYLFNKGVLIQQLADSVLDPRATNSKKKIEVFDDAYNKVDNQILNAGLNMIEPNAENIGFVKEGFKLIPCLIDFGSIQFLGEKLSPLYKTFLMLDEKRTIKTKAKLRIIFEFNDFQDRKNQLRDFFMQNDIKFFKNTEMSSERLNLMIPDQIYAATEYLKLMQEGLDHSEIIAVLSNEMIIYFSQGIDESMLFGSFEFDVTDDHEDVKDLYEGMKKSNPLFRLLDDISIARDDETTEDSA